MKPKENKGYNTGTYDECQTPPYALEPLMQPLFDAIKPNLRSTKTIWECASGQGTLAKEFNQKAYSVIDTDISRGEEEDFFNNDLVSIDHLNWHELVIVTNPPYSIKYEWLERCYYLGFPFALLMPVEMLGTAKGQRLFDKYGIEMIFMSPRVDFLMPHALWSGHGAQFPTAWFTWKLNLPKEMNYVTITKPKRKDLPAYWEKVLGKETYTTLLLQSFKHYFSGE